MTENKQTENCTYLIREMIGLGICYNCNSVCRIVSHLSAKAPYEAQTDVAEGWKWAKLSNGEFELFCPDCMAGRGN
jgi:hypothetical protein